MKNIILLFLITYTISKAQIVDIHISEEFVLGNDEYASQEYIFKNPMKIIIDSSDNFYVVDKDDFEIRKFSDDGQYLLKFGNVGEGPGEFRDITCITVEDDNIIVYDVLQQRYSYFDLNGKLKKSQNVNEARFVTPAKITLMDNSKFLFFEPFRTYESKKIFKIYNTELTTIFKEFIEWDEVYNENDRFDWTNRISEDIHFLYYQNTIVIVKDYYDNYIYFYDMNSDKMTKIKGYQAKYPSLEIMENLDYSDAPKLKKIVEFISGPEGKFRGIRHNQSVGIVRIGDYFGHFLIAEIENDDYIYLLELFDKNGNIAASKVLETRKKKPLPIRHRKIFTQDSKGAIYMRDSVDGIPVIKKIKVELVFN
ncbi:MAG: 6-bladed beta-propeller [Melioribacteraceae bacterium]|nr:6-bladed beta-propeller [Melioribacteraceae bacterium]MCF8354544.1 6-bladed beta-propeller [Melioribacteraceae bacterium]MCF8394476.1 6-bladed beta-propeller [Melioribacteraceae bacterium]MCF8420114.1 6-bladed beta-propeller [Melioribacteraceae bacterium]